MNSATLWCTPKAYARGLLIQVAAREKTNTLNNILKDITKLELHKKSPQDITLDHQLINLRSELRAVLIADPGP